MPKARSSESQTWSEVLYTGPKHSGMLKINSFVASGRCSDSCVSEWQVVLKNRRWRGWLLDEEVHVLHGWRSGSPPRVPVIGAQTIWKLTSRESEGGWRAPRASFLQDTPGMAGVDQQTARHNCDISPLTVCPCNPYLDSAPCVIFIAWKCS